MSVPTDPIPALPSNEVMLLKWAIFVAMGGTLSAPYNVDPLPQLPNNEVLLLKYLISAIASGGGDTPSSPYTSIVSTYKTNVEAAGGTVDSETLSALDSLVLRGTAEGWWSNVKECYPFCGNSLTAALVKLVNQAGTGTSLTNNNLVDVTDYTQLRGIGINSGNTDKALLTGFIPANFSLSAGNISLIVSTLSDQVASSPGAGATIGDLIAGNGGECGIYFQAAVNIIQNADFADYQALNQSPRVLSFSATSNAHHVSMNGVQMTAWTDASTTALTGEVSILKGTRFGATRFQNGVIGMVILGSYMTPAQTKLATAAILAFEKQIRNIYRVKDGLIGFGDSITATQGSTLSLNGFIPLLCRKLGYRNVNFGNPAAWLTENTGTIGGVNQVNDIATQPENTVVVSYGTNDGVNIPVSAANYGIALDTVLSTLTTAQKCVIVASPCYSTNATYTTAVQRGYAEQCAAKALLYNCVFADTNRSIADQAVPTDFMADANHPNTAGHAVMEQCIRAAMQGRNERSLSLDFPNTAAGASSTLTVEILNARVGQEVVITAPAGIEDALLFRGEVTGDDTVTIDMRNTNLITAIDPAPGFFTVSVKM